MKSILQDWALGLGLRHQGTLLTAVRGCDTAPKDDPSKLFVRCYRAVILNPHCGDVRKAATFIEAVGADELERRFQAFRKNCDHYPAHYLGHMMHSVEIVGYKHPDHIVRATWLRFYQLWCHGLHVSPETEMEMDRRLDADEESFAAREHSCDGSLIDWRKAALAGG